MLREVIQRIESTKESQGWTKDVANIAISEYLFHNRSIKNEDLYKMLRFALSASPKGPPVGDISEVLGRKETLLRLEEAAALLT